VTLLLLVPDKFLEHEGAKPANEVTSVPGHFPKDEALEPSSQAATRVEVRVVARTTVRSAVNGAVIYRQSRYDRLEHVAQLVSEFIPVNERNKVRTKECLDFESVDSRQVLCTQVLLQSIWANDFEQFENILREAGWHNSVGRFARDLWMDIVESLDKSYYAGVRFELPKATRIELPNDQTIFLIDDEKTAMRGVLQGGSGLVSVSLRAQLALKLKNGDSVPLAGIVTPGANGADPTLTFPSLIAWKIDGIDLDKTRLKGSNIEIFAKPVDTRWDHSSNLLRSQQYNKLNYRKVEDTDKVVFTIRRTVDFIKPDTNNHGTVKLFFELEKENTKPIATTVDIAVEGAELLQASFEAKGKQKESQTPELGKVSLKNDGALELTLRNLDKTRKVVIKASAKDASEKPIGPDHPSLEFDVK